MKDDPVIRIREVAEGVGLDPDCVAELFDRIAAAVASGHRVRVRGFGTFSARHRKGRQRLKLPGAVHSDEATFDVVDRRMLKFKASRKVRRVLNPEAAERQAVEAKERARKALLSAKRTK